MCAVNHRRMTVHGEFTIIPIDHKQSVHVAIGHHPIEMDSHRVSHRLRLKRFRKTQRLL